MRGGSIQVTIKAAIIGSASKTPFKWRFTGGPMMVQQMNAALRAFLFFRGSGPVLLRNPIFLWVFRGSGPPVHPLVPHMSYCNNNCSISWPFFVIQFCFYDTMKVSMTRSHNIMTKIQYNPEYGQPWHTHKYKTIKAKKPALWWLSEFVCPIY